jgi:glyoxylase-like metal-dependent hydrolase (beta-lactamase superfamily II)
MGITVRHLNACTLCPTLASRLNPQGRLVCHCLLIETGDGLVVVDTGVGLAAIEDPKRMLSGAFRTLVGPKLLPEETVARQVEARGFKRTDVKNVIVTHLDVDHAGGLADFPDATVHVLAAEHDAALHPRSWMERERYVQPQWAHGPKWALSAAQGEKWFGFDCVRQLPGLPPEILMVPVFGHTRGHCAVAVDIGGRWLLHCGDAYFFEGEMDATPRFSTMLSGFQRVVAVDNATRVANQRRLRELKAGNRDVTLFCAHDPAELDALSRG